MTKTNKQFKILSLFLKCTFKNTIITLTDLPKNQVLYTTSSKSFPLKMKRKNNAYVLQQISLQLLQHINNHNTKFLIVYTKGVGYGKYTIPRNLIQKNIKILALKDCTSVPFNGCRPKKRKRK